MEIHHLRYTITIQHFNQTHQSLLSGVLKDWVIQLWQSNYKTSQFYACFEESITEYSAQVNQFNIRENLLSLRGQATGSNVTHKRVIPTFGNTIRIAEQYGTEAGVGGTIDYKSGSIDIQVVLKYMI